MSLAPPIGLGSFGKQWEGSHFFSAQGPTPWRGCAGVRGQSSGLLLSLSAAPCCSEIRAMVPSHWVLAAQPRTQSVGQKAVIINESISSATSQNQVRLWPCQGRPVSFHRSRASGIHRMVGCTGKWKQGAGCRKVGGCLNRSQRKGHQLLINAHVCSVAEPKTGWKSPSINSWRFAWAVGSSSDFPLPSHILNTFIWRM